MRNSSLAGQPIFNNFAVVSFRRISGKMEVRAGGRKRGKFQLKLY